MTGFPFPDPPQPALILFGVPTRMTPTHTTIPIWTEEKVPHSIPTPGAEWPAVVESLGAAHAFTTTACFGTRTTYPAFTRLCGGILPSASNRTRYLVLVSPTITHGSRMIPAHPSVTAYAGILDILHPTTQPHKQGFVFRPGLLQFLEGCSHKTHHLLILHLHRRTSLDHRLDGSHLCR